MITPTVITFDADGTLWDFDLIMKSALSHVLLALRERVPTPEAQALTVEDMVTIRNQVAEEVRGRGIRLEEIRRLAIGRTLETVGVVDTGLVSDLTTLYFSHRFRDTGLFPDTLPALNALRSRFRLGLATNGNSTASQYHLAEYFHFTVYADDCGVSKPDPAFYQRVLQAACESPDEVLHVGDSLENDVQGAQSVNIHAAWINRHGESPPDAIRPDFLIRSLLELPSLLTATRR